VGAVVGLSEFQFAEGACRARRAQRRGADTPVFVLTFTRWRSSTARLRAVGYDRNTPIAGGEIQRDAAATRRRADRQAERVHPLLELPGRSCVRRAAQLDAAFHAGANAWRHSVIDAGAAFRLPED